MRRRALALSLLSTLLLPSIALSQEEGGGGEGATKPAESQPASEPAAAPAPESPKEQQKVKVGLSLQDIGKFDIATGTFSVEFIVSFTCEPGVAKCITDFDIEGGKISKKEEAEDLDPNKQAFKVKADVSADVDLKDFPFDKQALQITISNPQSDTSELVYEADPDDTSISEKVKIPGWDIATEPDASVETIKLEGADQDFSYYTFSLNIQRFKLSVFFKNFMPVLFTVFVMSLGLLLRPKSAASRLTMATGALAATATFHLSSTSTLPPIGYTTRVDKFMLSTYLIILMHIFCSVYLLKLDERKEEASANKLYDLAQYILPPLTILIYVLVIMGIF